MPAESHIQRIVRAYQEFGDSAGFTRVADLAAVAENDFSLNIALYVRPPTDTSDTAPPISLAETIADWQASSLALRESMADLFAMLEQHGLVQHSEPRAQ